MFCDPANGWTLCRGGRKAPETSPKVPPVWSPDGRLLSFRESNGWYDGEGKQLPDQPRPHSFAWRPDGQRYLGPGGGGP